MTTMEYITLNDGNKIPAIGFGTFQIPADGSTYEAVKTALSLGIRHIDTAVAYSYNIPAINVLNALGVEKSFDYMKNKLHIILRKNFLSIS